MKVTLKIFRFRIFRILFEINNSSKKRTILGFGDHQKMGSPSSNHGKMPLLYANNNRSDDKSPPMARMPSESALETGGKNNSLDKKYIVEEQKYKFDKANLHIKIQYQNF